MLFHQRLRPPQPSTRSTRHSCAPHQPPHQPPPHLDSLSCSARPEFLHKLRLSRRHTQPVSKSPERLVHAVRISCERRSLPSPRPLPSSGSPHARPATTGLRTARPPDGSVLRFLYMPLSAPLNTPTNRCAHRIHSAVVCRLAAFAHPTASTHRTKPHETKRAPGARERNVHGLRGE